MKNSNFLNSERESILKYLNKVHKPAAGLFGKNTLLDSFISYYHRWYNDKAERAKMISFIEDFIDGRRTDFDNGIDFNCAIREEIVFPYLIKYIDKYHAFDIPVECYNDVWNCVKPYDLDLFELDEETINDVVTQIEEDFKLSLTIYNGE